MLHHAYFIEGETEEAIDAALTFIHDELELVPHANPNVVTLRHGLLSVDDARKIRSHADLAPTIGNKKVLIITASRLFHEAQNALLKLFEEPPLGTVLILIIPTEGMLLPTLRSRLLPLPQKNSVHISGIATEFLGLGKAEQEKWITKLLDRTKSDKDEDKQAARLEAIQFIEGLIEVTYRAWVAEKKESYKAFLEDLTRFLPILHERSAPLKLIFEHIQLTRPKLVL